MRLVRDLGAMIVGLLLGAAVVSAFAQSLPPQASPSCEQQLEQAQRTIIQLRKANAQSDFQAASLQEAMMDLQKKQAEAEAKGKAAEKK